MRFQNGFLYHYNFKENLKPITKYLVGFAAVLLLLNGCRKDGDKTNWNVDALAPLVYTELKIGDLIPDSLTTLDENELVYLSYNDTAFRIELDTLIQLPDTSITESFSLPIGGIEIPGGTQIDDITEEIEIESGDIELKYASIQSGTIVVDLVSTFQGPVVCNYVIPNATLNGEPLMVEELVQGASSENPAVLQFTFDVSGYDLDFTNGTEPFNHLPTFFTVTADPDSPPLPVSFGDGVELTTTFQGITPTYAEGYFGQQVVETGLESEDINAFNLIQSGSIDLEEVNVGLRILNGFGVDIRATIHQLNAINNVSASNVPLNHSIIGSPINLNRATQPNNQPVPSAYDVELNNNNSQIDQMLEIFPDAFEIEANLELNPLGNISNHHDFAYATSTIDGVLDIDIPLCLIADNITLADTTDFSLGEDDAIDDINSGRLIIQLNNYFPLSGALSLKSLDEENTGMNLLDEGFFAAGMTNSDNEITGAVYTELYIDLDRQEIVDLQDADKLVFSVALSTSSLTEFVKIYNSHHLDIRIVADFNYHVNN